VHTATTDLQNAQIRASSGGWPLSGCGQTGSRSCSSPSGVCKENFSFTSLFNGAEINLPLLFPGGTTTGVAEVIGLCEDALGDVLAKAPSALRPPLTPGSVDLAKLEVQPLRALQRTKLHPQHSPTGVRDALLDVLQSDDPAKPWRGTERGTMMQQWSSVGGAVRHRPGGVREPHRRHAMKAGGDNLDTTRSIRAIAN